MASDALFSTLFSLGTSAYVACFCAAVYATTPSPAVSTFAVLALTALPAIVAADLCGNDKAAEHILGSYRREVFGTAAIVVLLCSTNAAVGHLGVEVEWPLHLALMMLCDTLSDGAQANPAVTLALWACGDCGVDCATAAGNIGAQLAGGVIGWQLLLFGFAQHLPGAVGGPRADAAVPLEYLMACEALACWVLACAVFTFATTKCFAGPSSCKYALKMALINASLRAVIHAHGLTGPSANPALATTYAYVVSGGAWPGRDHLAVYWAGACGGAMACGLAPNRVGGFSEADVHRRRAVEPRA
ncbi:aquaporin-like protein [Pelagophyceae sp. CCMP2097]|nr:aquaporin-like protein [Pelagophyceae sp. CCMP2097]